MLFFNQESIMERTFVVNCRSFTFEHVVYSDSSEEDFFMFEDEYPFDPKDLRSFVDALIERKHPDFVSLDYRYVTA
jgi:hypothetical protein